MVWSILMCTVNEWRWKKNRRWKKKKRKILVLVAFHLSIICYMCEACMLIMCVFDAHRFRSIEFRWHKYIDHRHYVIRYKVNRCTGFGSLSLSPFLCLCLWTHDANAIGNVADVIYGAMQSSEWVQSPDTLYLTRHALMSTCSILVSILTVCLMSTQYYYYFLLFPIISRHSLRMAVTHFNQK